MSTETLQYTNSHSGDVSIQVLQSPPVPKLPFEGIHYLLWSAQGRAPAVDRISWRPRDLTYSAEAVSYVPMNSCTRARLIQPGRYIGTGNLNGCTAVAAAFRDERDTAHTFLAHYDSEATRTLDDGERLRLAGLIFKFAGERAIKMMVAYPDYDEMVEGIEREHRLNDPETYPVDALIEASKQLSRGFRSATGAISSK